MTFGLTQKQCVDRMISAFGDETPTIIAGLLNFNVEVSSSVIIPVKVGPKTAVTQENVDAVLIEEDRHVTYREIQATLDIGISQIQIIPHEQLGVKKVVFPMNTAFAL